MHNVVDCFPYFNEKEILELRINILRDYVDKFIITESNYTFSGIPKDYTLKEVIRELGLQNDNIEVIEVDLSEENLGEPTDFDNFYHPGKSSRERIQRDAISKCLNTNNFDDDCVFIVSDCDEIINPIYIDMMCKLAREERNKIFKVDLVQLEGRADFRVYDSTSKTPIEWRYSLFLCLKEHIKNVSLNSIRADFSIPYEIVWPYTKPREENGIYIPGQRMLDLGWHFTWMGDNRNRLLKSKSFSHSNQYFDFIIHKNYSYDSMVNFIETYEFFEDNIGPSGNINQILRPYPLQDLPQIIFDLPRVKNFLLP